ncbi:3-oxoacyl-ACP reductase FabG [Halorhodospira halochloris]|uniref:3-oxoacyl-ACP reductase FabG n=1 Tax=Halorhodospira halochloris TaxID=1052 RepID=UPI001EE931D6|nr:3-oxoacyl-ACP reductase FabG [Halorhodospira halochloris]MCG5529936.1 3-oxoacyl-ACP reductase FabG [Halorhodospira halochloris]
MLRALVTGGSGDIGSAICRLLAAEGMEVLVHANKSLAKAEDLSAAIQADGGKAQPICFDVCDEAAVTYELGRELEKGPIQVLVNNAGISEDGPMAGFAPENWRRVVDVNLNGFFNVTQPLLLPMARKRWGRIINISSVAAVSGNRGQTNYAAAKSGLHGASRSLAREMGSRGITVNVVAPGIIAGSMTEDIFESSYVAQVVALERFGQPEEVASAVGFLSSHQAAYITGQVINVNGGMFL